MSINMNPYRIWEHSGAPYRTPHKTMAKTNNNTTSNEHHGLFQFRSEVLGPFKSILGLPYSAFHNNCLLSNPVWRAKSTHPATCPFSCNPFQTKSPLGKLSDKANLPPGQSMEVLLLRNVEYRDMGGEGLRRGDHRDCGAP